MKDIIEQQASESYIQPFGKPVEPAEEPAEELAEKSESTTEESTEQVAKEQSEEEIEQTAVLINPTTEEPVEQAAESNEDQKEVSDEANSAGDAVEKEAISNENMTAEQNEVNQDNENSSRGIQKFKNNYNRLRSFLIGMLCQLFLVLKKDRKFVANLFGLVFVVRALGISNRSASSSSDNEESEILKDETEPVIAEEENQTEDQVSTKEFEEIPTPVTVLYKLSDQK